MTFKEALSIFGLFFVGCFAVGFLAARHELGSEGHTDEGEVQRRLTLQPNGVGVFTLSCRGSGVLFRYSVGDDTATEDRSHTSKQSTAAKPDDAARDKPA
jgi:hypothetical protein